MEVRRHLCEGAIVGKGKKSVKDHVDTVVEQFPDAAELRELKDQLVERFPDRSEWLALRDDLIERFPDKTELLDLRDGLVDRLPNEVSDKLPIQKQQRFVGLRKVAFVGLLTAGIAGIAAFVKAKMADEQTYTASTYTTPGQPTGATTYPPTGDAGAAGTSTTVPPTI
jgi:hypothetical protein